MGIIITVATKVNGKPEVHVTGADARHGRFYVERCGDTYTVYWTSTGLDKANEKPKKFNRNERSDWKYRSR